MSPQVRKVVIPLLVMAVAIGIAALMILNSPPGGAGTGGAGEVDPDAEVAQGETETGTEAETGADSRGDAEDDPDDAEADQVPPVDPAAGGADDGGAGSDGTGAAGQVSLDGLHAVAPDGVPDQLKPLGSLDWREQKMEIEFAEFGSGIDKITLSDIWATAKARREADKVKDQIIAGTATLDALAEGELQDQRYVLQQTRDFRISGADWRFPAFVARSININGVDVSLFDQVWSQDATDPGRFTSEIHNADGEPILRLSRRYILSPIQYDITVLQSIQNLTSQPLSIMWHQYGAADLDVDRSRYMDRRRFRIGHLGDPARAGYTPTLVEADADFFYERTGVAKMAGKEDIWPNPDSAPHKLVWFAQENRYFGMAIHPIISVGTTSDYSLESIFNRIQPFYDGEPDWRDELDANRQKTGNKVNVGAGYDNVAIGLFSPKYTIAPGATQSLDYGIYAGPLDRHTFGGEQPYQALRMDKLILYQMSSFCAFCTFQWLAGILLWLLSLGHTVTGDWAVAIIGLVVVVRLALHPITKKSQTAVQRFGKAMQSLKPEMDKLQAKFKEEPKRLQQEQMRLWREHGVSPVSALGCLPMFLQMPIWVALYAMLYFAYDLRQEGAFWGAFQMIPGWSFLGDLSAADHFFYEFNEPFSLFFWNMTGINLLPILMGGLFYFQQKYMTPQTANMSKEQQSTQRIMKVMMVVMMPVFLYSAPSGLTLYILTSSTWGIIESRMIRKHIDQMDLKPVAAKKKTPAKKKKPKDAQARAYQAAVERAKNKRKGPAKKYKKR